MTTKQEKIKIFQELIQKEQNKKFKEEINAGEITVIESKKNKGVAAKNVEKELKDVDAESQLTLDTAIAEATGEGSVVAPTESKPTLVSDNTPTHKLPRDLAAIVKLCDKLAFKPSKSKAGWYELDHSSTNSELAILKSTVIYVLIEEDVFSAVNTFGKVQKAEFPFYEKDQKYNAIDNLWYWIMDQLIVISKSVIELRVLKQVARLNEYEVDGTLMQGYIIRNLDDRVYHHLKAPGVSNSTLGESEDSSMALDEKHFPDPDQPKEEEPKYFITGRSVHDYILRNDIFLENNYVKPDKKNWSKRGLQEDKIHELLGVGKNIITETDLRGYKKAHRNLMKHPTAKMLMDVGENELSAYGKLTVECPKRGKFEILQRARFDKIIVEPKEDIKEYMAEHFGLQGDYGIITDLKYLRDNTDFRNKASDVFFEYGYHRAGAYYCHIAENIYKKRFYFIFMTVAKKNTHDVICYLLPDQFRRMGEESMADLALKYVTDYKNVFNPVVDEFLKIPKTMFRKLEISDDERKEVYNQLCKIQVPYTPDNTLMGLDLFCDLIDGKSYLMSFFAKHPNLAKRVSRNLGWRGRHGDIIRIDASPRAMAQHKPSNVLVLKNNFIEKKNG